MPLFSPAEIDAFGEHGYVLARGAVTGERLAALQRRLAAWVEESRGHTGNWGACLDGKARFDLEAGHNAAHPRLRRVANPAEIDEDYRSALFDSAIPDHVAELIGPDVKFHHCKVNVKLPGTETEVGWHQDHAYDPHTNDSMVTTLLFLTDVTADMGPLLVAPGTHRTPFSHHDGARFTGSIAPDKAREIAERAVALTGEAGDLVVMHTWLAHGGGPNRTDRPRALLICDYTAADAFPLKTPAMPNRLHGAVVRGEATRFARLGQGIVEVPAPYDDDSFFGLQGQKTATTDSAAETT